MSYWLDKEARRDPQRAADLDRTDAEMAYGITVPRMVKVSGRHLGLAPNDPEMEPGEEQTMEWSE